MSTRITLSNQRTTARCRGMISRALLWALLGAPCMTFAESSPSHGQPPSTPPWAAVSASQDPRHAQAVLTAWRQSNSGDIEGAVQTLRALIQKAGKNGVPVSVVVLLAGFYRQQERDDDAFSAYKQALNQLGAEAKEYPVNLALELAMIRIRQDDHANAIPFLLQAWQHSTNRPDDPRVLSLLSEVFEEIGAQAGAYGMSTAVLLLEPADQAAWERVARTASAAKDLSTFTQKHPELPPIPVLPALHAVLAHGSPGSWTPAMAKQAFPAYVELARELTKRGQTESSRRWRSVILRTVLSEAVGQCKIGHYRECLNRLVAAATNYPEHSRPPFVRFAGLRLQALVQLELGNFAHAIAATEKLLAMGSVEFVDSKELMNDMLGPIMFKAFSYVSFDPQNGSPRDDDPTDFVGHSLGRENPGFDDATAWTVARTKRYNTSRRYGQVSPSEDFSDIFGQNLANWFKPKLCEPVGVDANLAQLADLSVFRRLMVNRIETLNLELPVKVLLALGGVQMQTSTGSRGKPLLVLLDNAISRSGDKVAASTQTAFMVGKWLARIQAMRSGRNPQIDMRRCPPMPSEICGGPPDKIENALLHEEIALRLGTPDRVPLELVPEIACPLGWHNGLDHQFGHMMEIIQSHVDYDYFLTSQRGNSARKTTNLYMHTNHQETFAECREMIDSWRKDRQASARDNLASGTQVKQVAREALMNGKLDSSAFHIPLSISALRAKPRTDRLFDEQTIVDLDDGVRAERRVRDQSLDLGRKQLFSLPLTLASPLHLKAMKSGSPALGDKTYDPASNRVFFEGLLFSVERAADGRISALVLLTAGEQARASQPPTTSVCKLAPEVQTQAPELVSWVNSEEIPSMVLVVGSLERLGKDEIIFKDCVIARTSP